MLSMRLMRFLPKIHPIYGRNLFFLSVLKSHTQIGFDGVINLEPNISCLGPFKKMFAAEDILVLLLPVNICVHCAGIFEHSMGARNQVGIWCSYRPARL